MYTEKGYPGGHSERGPCSSDLDVPRGCISHSGRLRFSGVGSPLLNFDSFDYLFVVEILDWSKIDVLVGSFAGALNFCCGTNRRFGCTDRYRPLCLHQDSLVSTASEEATAPCDQQHEFCADTPGA